MMDKQGEKERIRIVEVQGNSSDSEDSKLERSKELTAPIVDQTGTTIDNENPTASLRLELTNPMINLTIIGFMWYIGYGSLVGFVIENSNQVGLMLVIQDLAAACGLWVLGSLKKSPIRKLEQQRRYGVLIFVFVGLLSIPIIFWAILTSLGVSVTSLSTTRLADFRCLMGVVNIILMLRAARRLKKWRNAR